MKTLALISSSCIFAALAPLSAAPQATTTVTLVKGDTLYSLARKHSTTPQAIMAANGIESATSLAIGAKLTIPHRSKTSTATADTPAAKRPPAPAMKKFKTGSGYEVKAGDTLYGISRKLNISVADLKAANPKINANNIAIGTLLRTSKPKASVVKKAAAPVAKAKKAPAKPKAKKAKAPTKFAKQTSSGRTAKALPPVKAEKKKLPEPKFETKADTIRSVRLNKRMTYGQIAAKHGTSVTALNKLNGLKLTNRTLIAQGAELYVPGY